MVNNPRLGSNNRRNQMNAIKGTRIKGTTIRGTRIKGTRIKETKGKDERQQGMSL
jgi:hypothetical protein